MLKVLERNYKQSSEEVEAEFPNCKYVMRVDSVHDDAGYLLSVSTAMDSDIEFWEYCRELSKEIIPFFGGEYGKWIGGLFSVAEC